MATDASPTKHKYIRGSVADQSSKMAVTNIGSKRHQKEAALFLLVNRKSLKNLAWHIMQVLPFTDKNNATSFWCV